MNSIDAPLVSVIIPVHNGEAVLKDAIEGVLLQTYAQVECIVIDDGSTDGTADLAQAFAPRVRVTRQPNRGVAAARNAGARAGFGQFVAFCDADDAWINTKLERQMELFRHKPELGLVYCGIHLTDADLRPVEYSPAPSPDEALRNTLLLEPPIVSAAQTVVLPRSVFDEVGGFNEDLSTSADVEFACRVAMRFPIGGIPDPLVLYRQHGSQMHRDIARTERDMEIVFDRLFSDPHLPADLRGLRRRAEANLLLTLALSHLARGERSAFCTKFLRATRRHPLRVVTRVRDLLARRFMHRSGAGGA